MTSPGGTTAAALAVLMDAETGLGALLQRAVGAAGGPGEGARRLISFDDFQKVEIRLGVIVAAEDFPEARKPAIRLRVDFGGAIGVKRSSAQLTRHYRPETLVGRQVLAVVNFPPRQIGPVMSDVLVLGVPDADGEGGADRPGSGGSPGRAAVLTAETGSGGAGWDCERSIYTGDQT